MKTAATHFSDRPHFQTIKSHWTQNERTTLYTHFRMSLSICFHETSIVGECKFHVHPKQQLFQYQSAMCQ